jgi:hypothetical protein
MRLEMMYVFSVEAAEYWSVVPSAAWCLLNTKAIVAVAAEESSSNSSPIYT